jgi:hypothetical protein
MMTDETPSSDDLETWVKRQPLDVLARLPNVPERRWAEDLIRLAHDLARQARERRPDR